MSKGDVLIIESIADFRLPIADLVFGFWSLVFAINVLKQKNSNKAKDQRSNRQPAIANRQCFYGCIFWIVTVTIGVAPPVLLYEIQYPTFG